MDARQKIGEAADAFNETMHSAGDKFNRYSHAQQFLLACVEAADRYVRDGGIIPMLDIGEGHIAVSEAPSPTESTSAVESGNDLPRILKSGPIVEADRENEFRHDPTPLRRVRDEAETWPWAEEIERKLGGNKR